MPETIQGQDVGTRKLSLFYMPLEDGKQFHIGHQQNTPTHTHTRMLARYTSFDGWQM